MNVMDQDDKDTEDYDDTLSLCVVFLDTVGDNKVAVPFM